MASCATMMANFDLTFRRILHRSKYFADPAMDFENFLKAFRRPNEQPRSCDLLARPDSTSILVLIFSCDGEWTFKEENNSDAAKPELKSNFADFSVRIASYLARSKRIIQPSVPAKGDNSKYRTSWFSSLT